MAFMNLDIIIITVKYFLNNIFIFSGIKVNWQFKDSI